MVSSLQVNNKASPASSSPIVVEPPPVLELSFFRRILPFCMHESRNPLNFSLDLPIDYSDNEEQMDLLKRHYAVEMHEIPHDDDQEDDHAASHPPTLRQILADYNPHSTINELFDGMPVTYRGKRGVRRMFRDLRRQRLRNLTVEHVAVNRNHGQVVWKADTVADPPQLVVGTDSFTFDDQGRIEAQTIVAITIPKE